MATSAITGNFGSRNHYPNLDDEQYAPVNFAASSRSLQSQQSNPFSPDTDSSQLSYQPSESDSGEDFLKALQSIGQQLDELEQTLSVDAGPSNAASGSSGPLSSGSDAAPLVSSSGASVAGNGASSANGPTADVDGGNVNGTGVTEKIDNNTGSAAKFGWENAQGKVVGEVGLANNSSGSIVINPNGPDAQSARLIKLNSDGSVPAESNLDEQNLAVGPNGIPQNSVDVSEITKGSDPTQIKITDGKGSSFGDNAPGGAYLYPTQDQNKNPLDNPNTGALDPSKFFDNKFTN